MTRKAKSGSWLTPSGCTLNSASLGTPVGSTSRSTAAIIASRQMSVRASVTLSQKALAQFSVLKYRLKPQIGLMATTTATMGKPVRSHCETAARSEPRVSRKRTPHRSRLSSHQFTA